MNEEIDKYPLKDYSQLDLYTLRWVLERFNRTEMTGEEDRLLKSLYIYRYEKYKVQLETIRNIIENAITKVKK